MDDQRHLEPDEFTHHHPAPKQKEVLTATNLKRLDVSTEYFQQRLAEQKRLDEISKRLGMFDRKLSISKRVRIELQSATEDYFVHVGMANFCSQHVYEWFIDRNPYHIDLVMMVCADHGIEPTPTIIELAAEQARSKFNGSPSGTAVDLLKEHAKRQTFTLMMNLIHNGASLKEASSKAAQWRRNTYPDMARLKASSLEKEYTKIYRQPGYEGLTTEARHFQIWDEHSPADWREYWRKARTLLPLADSDLTGERR